jgi:VWFA-related protein
MANHVLAGILGTCMFLSFATSSSAQSATPQFAQTPQLKPRTHDERESKYQAAHRVYLSVRVTDASGQPVTGLEPKDFALLEDQNEREIKTFRSVDGARASVYNHVVLMLDAVNNSSRSLEQSRKDIDRFLHESHEPLAHSLAIGVFSEYGARVGEASRDRDVLSAQLKALTKEDFAWSCGNEVDLNQSFMAAWMPGTPSTAQSSKTADCLNQRFLRSVSALSQLAKKQADVAGRMLLIWLGSGWPLLSSHEFRPDTVAFKRNNFHYLAELSNDLREGQITLYTMSEHDLFRMPEWHGDQGNPLLNGVSSDDHVSAGSFAVQVLAHQTGGLILENRRDIARDIAAAIAECDSYYAISFEASATEVPDRFHSVAVKVLRPGLVTRTNTVYYGQP